jgi:hypothetical protein
MKLSSRITVAFALAFIPLGIALAAPGNVTGIKGEFVNGKVHVSWQKPAGEEPTAYRIFYSRQSILQQNGLYDDFELAPATALDYTFDSLPYATDTLYVSVLAVNAKGEESPLFLEEARIVTGSSAVSQPSSIPNPASSSTASVQQASSAMQLPTGGALRILSAKAISATGVLVTFSSTVQIDPAKAAQAFTLKDASGTTLRITRLVILGNEVTLNTVTQQRSRVYRLTASEDVKGKDAQGAAMMMDAQQGDVLFTGHETGSISGPTMASSMPSMASSSRSSVAMGPSVPMGQEEVRSLTLRGQAQGATYQIDATWQPPLSGGVKEYRVSQTLDGGRTYGKAQTIPGSSNGAKIGSVPGGTFGLLVQIVFTNGATSRGAMQSITLPLKGTGNGTLGSITQKPTGSHLPNSGVALSVPMLLSGAGVGMQMWRRKRMALKTV